MKCPVVNLENKKVGEVELNKDIFGLEVRSDILNRMVNYQRAKAQAGTHQTKGISDISGTTKKPFRQKGTGNARAGSLRSPQNRGGATIFGPQTRSHAHDLPKKVRKLALKTALSAKKAAGELIILDNMELKEIKTKKLLDSLKSLGVDSALFVDGHEVNQNFFRASMNVVGVEVLPQQGANVLSILKRKHLVLSKDAVDHLEARLK